MYIDVVSGAVYSVPADHLEWNGATATLRGVPIWDAPVVITDRVLVHLLPQ